MLRAVNHRAAYGHGCPGARQEGVVWRGLLLRHPIVQRLYRFWRREVQIVEFDFALRWVKRWREQQCSGDHGRQVGLLGLQLACVRHLGGNG